MPTARRSRRTAVLAATAATALVAFAAGCGDDDKPAIASTQSPAATSTQHSGSGDFAIHNKASNDFQDTMRVLWQDHGNLTVRAIVAYVAKDPELDAVVKRLLRNQADLGNAVKPYYGDAAGKQLTTLLEEHINTAVGTLKAAASGDNAATKIAAGKFYANGDEIADFLATANPEHWSKTGMRQMMKTHLDEVIELATAQIKGQHAKALDIYDAYMQHIFVGMADMLSKGIIAQFPDKFA